MNNIQPADVTIRTTLKPGDIGYVTYLHGYLYQQEYGYGVSFEAYVAQGLYEFYKNYDSALDRVWIAEHNNNIVGFLLLMHRQPGEAQLRYFIIHPAYRGIGLGKKMAQLYMDFFMAKGYTKSYLWTTNELYTAACIYRKMGFTLTEDVPSTSFGKPLNEQRYDMVINHTT